jgi:hypothetical protein
MANLLKIVVDALSRIAFGNFVARREQYCTVH